MVPSSTASAFVSRDGEREKEAVSYAFIDNFSKRKKKELLRVCNLKRKKSRTWIARLNLSRHPLHLRAVKNNLLHRPALVLAGHSLVIRCHF
jgi:hypothetical protein